MHDFASNPLFELAPVAYSVLDTDFVQIAANRRFSQLFGYPAGAMTSSAQLTHPDDAERTRIYLDQLLDGAEPSPSIEKRYVRADGSIFWGRLTATVVELDGRRLLLGIIEDIQTQHDLLRDLSEQAELRSKFVSQVSHELRNPLHLIGGTSELLTQAPIPMKHRQQAAGILREATSLTRLVDDLLDIGRSEAGRLTLEDDVFSTRSLVDRIRQTVAEMATKKGLSFDVDVAETVPVHVAGDEGRLRQILVNLASNAVKFTPRGGVTLDVDLDPDRLVRFRVRDTGPGIPEQGLETIFEPFVRFSRSESGAGLGLAIASRLATLLGGTLTVSNLHGGGAEFDLRLPLSEATPRIDVGEPQRQREHSSSTSGKHILIVEDNLENQLLASAQLESLGFTSDIAPDGFEALELLASEPYDAVLMDWHLPGMDGLETTRRLRSTEASNNAPRVPVIALTARAMAADVEACLDAGADDHVAKPASLDTLRSVLNRWTAGRPEPARIGRRQRTGEPRRDGVVVRQSRRCRTRLLDRVDVSR